MHQNNAYAKRISIGGLITFCLIALIMPSEEYLGNFPELNNIGSFISNIPNVERYIASSNNQQISIIFLLIGACYCIFFSIMILYLHNFSASPLETGAPIEFKHGIFDIKVENKILKIITVYLSFGIVFAICLYILFGTSLTGDTHNLSRKAAGSIVIFKYLRSFIIGEGVLIWMLSMSISILFTMPIKVLIYKFHRFLS